MVQVMKWYSISLRIFDIKKPKTENVHPGFLQNEAAGSTGIQSHFLGWDASSSHVTLPTLLVFPQLPLGKVPYLRKVQSAVEPSGTFRQSLSWFLQHEPYPYILLSGDQHPKNKVSLPRTQHKDLARTGPKICGCRVQATVVHTMDNAIKRI